MNSNQNDIYDFIRICYVKQEIGKSTTEINICHYKERNEVK